MPRENIGEMDCPVCGHPGAHVRESKAGRPYVLCEECGHQTFCRGEKSAAIVRGKMRASVCAAAQAAQPAAAPASLPAKPAKPAPAKPEPAPSFWDSFFSS